MSYRTICVNDKSYQYVVGRTHTKIKGLGLFLNETIGVKTALPSKAIKWVVTPSRVSDIISGQPLRPMDSCEHGTVTNKMTCDPYDAELHDVCSMMIDCKQCVDARRWEI